MLPVLYYIILKWILYKIVGGSQSQEDVHVQGT